VDPSKGMLPLLGLQALLEYGRAGSACPPATAALLAANVLVFLRPGALDAILPKKAYVALNPNMFFKVRCSHPPPLPSATTWQLPGFCV
jgi:rhomboid domain-containing protein 1